MGQDRSTIAAPRGQQSHGRDRSVGLRGATLTTFYAFLCKRWFKGHRPVVVTGTIDEAPEFVVEYKRCGRCGELLVPPTQGRIVRVGR